ncbi:MAG: electron transport complex subunit RsxA [Candidatus Firestonebacteria bacterium]|nr:electron transport complex subunit RsxA [Candidatus Firestonebacteria bacterium]
MDIGRLIVIIIGAILVNNFVLTRFLGICPFLGVSKDTDSAIGMGLAVIFVMTLASGVSFIIEIYVLKLFKIEFLRTMTFILVIATLVQMIEPVILKTSPILYKALGIYLPLITTNCTVLGVALLNSDKNYSFIESMVHGFAGGVGFTLALILMSCIRYRFHFSKIPKPFQGIPIAFITSGIMAMGFIGFAGLIIQ